MEKIKKIINFFSYLIFIIYLFILFHFRDKIFEGLESLNSLNGLILFSIISLVLVSILNKSIKFALINSLFGITNFKKTIVIFLSSFFLCLAPGRLVEFYRIKLISERKDGSLTKSVYINILDKSTDLLCLGAYGSLGLIVFLPALFKTIFFEKFQIIMLIFSLLLVITFIAYILLKKQSIKLTSIFTILITNKKKILVIFLLTLLSWAPEIFSFYYLFNIMVNSNLEMHLVTSFYTVANVLGGLIPLPAGAIGFEGTLIYLLSNYLPLNILVSIIFLHRTTVISTTFVTGTVFFCYSKIVRINQKINYE